MRVGQNPVLALIQLVGQLVILPEIPPASYYCYHILSVLLRSKLAAKHPLLSHWLTPQFDVYCPCFLCVMTQLKCYQPSGDHVLHIYIYYCYHDYYRIIMFLNYYFCCYYNLLFFWLLLFLISFLVFLLLFSVFIIIIDYYYIYT